MAKMLPYFQCSLLSEAFTQSQCRVIICSHVPHGSWVVRLQGGKLLLQLLLLVCGLSVNCKRLGTAVHSALVLYPPEIILPAACRCSLCKLMFLGCGVCSDVGDVTSWVHGQSQL